MSMIKQICQWRDKHSDSLDVLPLSPHHVAELIAEIKDIETRRTENALHAIGEGLE